jgi:hypothetical protein
MNEEEIMIKIIWKWNKVRRENKTRKKVRYQEEEEYKYYNVTK